MYFNRKTWLSNVDDDLGKKVRSAYVPAANESSSNKSSLKSLLKVSFVLLESAMVIVGSDGTQAIKHVAKICSPFTIQTLQCFCFFYFLLLLFLLFILQALFQQGGQLDNCSLPQAISPAGYRLLLRGVQPA